MTNGQRALISQWLGENPKAPRTWRKGQNLRAEQTQRTGGNSMALRTQHIGVNPETEDARSHTLTSRGVNIRVGSTHLNQDARSSTRNIF